VRILDNLSTGSVDNLESARECVDLIKGDIREPADCRAACRGVGTVYHQAALPSVVRSIEDPATANEVNVSGTLNVLLAARDASVERWVFASSSSVYGDTERLPKHESDAPCPLSPYALAKWTGEHYARLFHRLYGLATISLRYFNVFGPHQDPCSPYAAVIPLFIRAALQGEALSIHGDGSQTRDFTYIDDVVAANLACGSAPPSAFGQTYNVAAGRRTSIFELAQSVGRLVEQPFRYRFSEPRSGDVKDSQADVSAALRDLGWEAKVPLEAGLRHTVDWLIQREDVA
jgi:nucleoside-diphosphate-sugar epimerase